MEGVWFWKAPIQVLSTSGGHHYVSWKYENVKNLLYKFFPPFALCCMVMLGVELTVRTGASSDHLNLLFVLAQKTIIAKW